MISTCQPAPPLRRYVRYYYQVTEQLLAATELQPVPARSPQIIEFMLGTPYRVQRLGSDDTDEAHRVTVVGAQTHRRLNLLLSGAIDAFTIAFEPGGFSALFSVPADELTNQHFDGRDVFGRALGRLHERLAEVETFEDRKLVSDQFLCERMPQAGDATSAIWAARELHHRSGRGMVVDLASAAELSVRQFERRFRHEIGMSPKLYARVVRFEAALRIKAAQPQTHWSEIAQIIGYYDQMHMVHDFNQLSGESPNLIWNQLDMFVKPEVETRGYADLCQMSI